MKFDTPQKLLRKNHSSQTPARMLILDTEFKAEEGEDETVHKMYLAWTCYLRKKANTIEYYEEWKCWETTYPLWKYIADLVRQRTVLYIFGHNLLVDLQASEFFYWFAHWNWTVEFLYQEGIVFILIISKDECRVKLVSTTNYFDTSLAKIGDLVGLPKGEVDFDRDPYDKIKEYCKRDVEILVKAMTDYIRWVNQSDLGKFRLTTASQALCAYRHRFMSEKIYIHRHENTMDLERSAYMGGRVECFFIGKPAGAPFVSLDVNSMYPYVMAEHDYPCKLLDHRPGSDCADIDWLLRDYCVIAKVLLNTQTPLYAVRSEFKLIFPIGKFEAFLCTEGLKQAMARGHLHEILELSIYEKAPLFRDYVDYFYQVRREYKVANQPVLVEFTKLLMNTLYGKFGQRYTDSDREICMDADSFYSMQIIDLVTRQKVIEYQLLNTRIVETKQTEGNLSFPAIAGHVTEYARFKLVRIIEAAGWTNVLYCDTDSVMIRKSNLGRLKALVDPNQLGALKIERTFDELNILGPKSYHAGDITRLKGIPRHATQIAPTHYKYMSFPKLKTHLKERINRGQIVREVIKTIRSDYDKGKVLPDGSVQPFILSQF